MKRKRIIILILVVSIMFISYGIFYRLAQVKTYEDEKKCREQGKCVKAKFYGAECVECNQLKIQ